MQPDIYQDILEHFMLPSADKLYGDADFLPTVPKPLPSALLTMLLTVLDWPANIPDLNHIWILWDIFKRKMRNSLSNIQDELKAQ